MPIMRKPSNLLNVGRAEELACIALRLHCTKTLLPWPMRDSWAVHRVLVYRIIHCVIQLHHLQTLSGLPTAGKHFLPRGLLLNSGSRDMAYPALPMVPVSIHAHGIISQTSATSGPLDLISKHLSMHSLLVQPQYSVLTISYEGVHARNSGLSLCFYGCSSATAHFARAAAWANEAMTVGGCMPLLHGGVC